VLVVMGGILLGRRNVRLSRGDREGASRVASTLGGMIVISGLLMAHQSFELTGTLATLLVLVARGALFGLMAYTFYMALEPDVRRRWPETLVAWSRVTDARFSDPLVGRDLLFGIGIGALLQLLTQAGHLAPAWFGHGPTLSPPPGGYDGTLGFGIATVIARVVASVLIATSIALVYLLIYILLRRRITTSALLGLVLFGVAVATQGASVSLIFAALGVTLVVFTLRRYGILALVVALAVSGSLDQIPMTFDPSSLFAQSSYTVLGLIVAGAVFGFRSSLGGKTGLAKVRLLD
jgi:hypothetical protein